MRNLILPISPSLLQTFKLCPFQYKIKYITKEIIFKPNAAALHGIRIHKAIERSLHDDTIKLPNEILDVLSFLEKIKIYSKKSHVDMYIEKRLAVSNLNTACTWNDKNLWYRCISDVLLIDHKKKLNIIIDWKTGKPNDNKIQTDILSMCATKKTGYVKNLILLIYLKNFKIVKKKINLTTLDPVKNTMESFKDYKISCQNANFPATPNLLCKSWCDVVFCIYNGKNEKNK